MKNIKEINITKKDIFMGIIAHIMCIMGVITICVTFLGIMLWHYDTIAAGLRAGLITCTLIMALLILDNNNI